MREALRARRRELYRLWLEEPVDTAEVSALREVAEALGVPISTLEAGEFAGRLDPASRRSNPQGIMLEAGPLPTPGLDDLIAALPPGGGVVVVLDGVEDPQNVGALVRVAEAAGVSGLVLSERRAPPLSPAVARASAGALEWLPVIRVANLPRSLDLLRDAGSWVVGADHRADQGLFELSDRLLSGRLVLVLGAEGRGLREGIRKRVDHVVSLPMRGHVDSLNVATAGAVMLYELLRRREQGM